MPSFEYSFCPDCKKWLPSDTMNYFEGMKVCNWCLNQAPTPNEFIHDPYYGKTQCIMCDSYDTDYIPGTKPRKFKCHECGEEFIE